MTRDAVVVGRRLAVSARRRRQGVLTLVVEDEATGRNPPGGRRG